MTIGQLKDRVTIRRPVETEDGQGLPVITWQDVATVPANIRHPSGIEMIKADALMSVVRASIRIRKRSDVTAAMRAVCGATTYEVKAVLPSDDRRWMFLTCEVVT